MLAALGLFVFDMSTTLFDELARKREWRHARTDRFGAMAASQFVGPGDDKVTISGTLVPEVAGSGRGLSPVERRRGGAGQLHHR